jgi:hypothetical protein
MLSSCTFELVKLTNAWILLKVLNRKYTVNGTFTDIALELFRFQATRNPIYKAFVENLNWVMDVGGLDHSILADNF